MRGTGAGFSSKFLVRESVASLAGILGGLACEEPHPSRETAALDDEEPPPPPSCPRGTP
jgi:hypothetical protein